MPLSDTGEGAAPSEQAPRAVSSPQVSTRSPTSTANVNAPIFHNGNLICPTIDSIPPGRQPSRILQCGMCYSDNPFYRKADLERHMRTHLAPAFACTVQGCNRGGANGFKRNEHLQNHLRNIHGTNGNGDNGEEDE